METMLPLELSLENCQLSDEQFFQLCQHNQNYRFERNALGDITIMSPTGAATGRSNAGLTAQLWNWNQKTGLGQIFDSSTGFNLPNGATRSPDAAWIPLARWNAISETEKQRFLPICPDFVVELLSPTDQLSRTQAKMQEYIANGTKLGWLINRKSKQVEIYRADRAVEILEQPTYLSGEGLLPDFQLDLSTIW